MLWESFISASTKLTSRCVITELGAVGCRASAHVAADHVSVLVVGAAEQALVSQSENCPTDFPHNCQLTEAPLSYILAPESSWFELSGVGTVNQTLTNQGT